MSGWTMHVASGKVREVFAVRDAYLVARAESVN